MNAPHRTEIRVRFPECDSMGIVYHGAYLQYFEIGRTEMLREGGLPYSEVERRGFRLVVCEAAARYRRPARYDQRLAVLARVKSATPARVTFAYEVRDAAGDELLAEGTTTHACLREGKPIRIPAEILRALGL